MQIASKSSPVTSQKEARPLPKATQSPPKGIIATPKRNRNRSQKEP